MPNAFVHKGNWSLQASVAGVPKQWPEVQEIVRIAGAQRLHSTTASITRAEAELSDKKLLVWVCAYETKSHPTLFT